MYCPNTVPELDIKHGIPYNNGKDNIALLRGEPMIVAKVTSKGQITIPKRVREKLGVHPGEDIGFEEKDGVVFIRKAVTKSPFDRWVGTLRQQKGKKTDDIIKDLRGE